MFAYDDGEVRQQFNICCTCSIIGGSLVVSGESTAVRFVDLEEKRHAFFDAYGEGFRSA